MSDDPATQPVEPRAAATVLLVRDEPAGGDLQVFLQRRVAGMAFAGGMTVFPGGGVSAGDEPDPPAGAVRTRPSSAPGSPSRRAWPPRW